MEVVGAMAMDLTPDAQARDCAGKQEDGSVEADKRECGAFRRDWRWWSWRAPGCTGRARLRHLKPWASSRGWSMPDMADAQWLATLARAGLLRASFIPVAEKLVGMYSAEKNRLHKVLVDAGIRINVVGWGCVRATTRVRANARAGASAKAMPGCASCCASLPRPQLAHAAPSRPSSMRWLPSRKGHKKSIVALAHKMLRVAKNARSGSGWTARGHFASVVINFVIVPTDASPVILLPSRETSVGVE